MSLKASHLFDARRLVASADTAITTSAPVSASARSSQNSSPNSTQSSSPSQTARMCSSSETVSVHRIDSTRHALFLRCFTVHEATIRAYVRRLMPSRVDADDVMQEVALVLWAKFSEFHDGGDFRNWAMGVARYEVLAWLRDKSRDRLVLSGDVAELIADESLQHIASFDQQRQALETCLNKLAPNQRSLLLDSYKAEAKIQDVALTSGRSVTGFYQWLHRMRHLLLNCVQHEVMRASCPKL